MTRAAALALRAAGGLRENCVVVLITDTPTIGTAGNTSPTEIEINPTGPSEFGTTARVHTAFAPSAWAGVYDIDLGTAGSIVELRDDFGNVVKDQDANAPTVHAQWPWHLGSGTFRDNRAEDSVFFGFPGTGPFLNNRIEDSTLDFTGKTAGTVNQSTFLQSIVTTGAAAFNASRLEMTGSTVANAGTGQLSFTGTQIEQTTNALVLQAADTQGALVIGCRWLNGFRINLARTGGGLFSASATTFQGGSTDPVGDLRALGAGAVSLLECEIVSRAGGGANSMFLLDGSGGFQAVRARISDSSTTAPGGIVTDAASTGALQITESEIITGQVRQNGAGALSFTAGCRMVGGSVTHAGSGLVTLLGVKGSSNTVSTAVGSTRGLTLGPGSVEASTVTQNGTGSANADNLHVSTGVQLHRATVTLNITDPAAGAQTYQGLAINSGGTLTVAGNPGGGGNPLNNTLIETQGTLNIQAGGSASRCRIAGEAVLNTGAFQNLGCVIEGQVTKTSTGANVNKLCNVGFDNWI